MQRNLPGKIDARSSMTVIMVLALAGAPRSLYTQGAPVPLTRTLTVEGATLQIDFGPGTLGLPADEVTQRIQSAAQAVAAYYGKFPVPRVRIQVLPVASRHGVLQGTTWGNRNGAPAFLRLRLGQEVTRQELSTDWIITHELVHTAFASLPDDQHWLEEGLASYVEPIARVQAGQLAETGIWADMVRGMPNGEPEETDRGLDNTHTWGRTYWGGALFCLMADVDIRRRTRNLKGLQDALRAIVAAGATIDTERPLDQVLKIGDQATGTHVLQEMYAKWSVTPVMVDLPSLWKQLGIQIVDGNVTLDSSAPLATVRQAITASPRK